MRKSVIAKVHVPLTVVSDLRKLSSEPSSGWKWPMYGGGVCVRAAGVGIEDVPGGVVVEGCADVDSGIGGSVAEHPNVGPGRPTPVSAVPAALV